ncbi:MAG TPA: HAD-IA family hydrolase [Salinisphaeraceae bacterium]|nr:HAD-IA family hydrolase [Salinisphaeraceae bacterium]
MTQATPRAVLFDMDGTLLDTAPDLAGAVNQLRIEAGLDALPVPELAPMCSYGARGMLQTGLGLHPGDADYAVTHDAFIARYRECMTQDTQPYAGMRELVQTIVASGWAWGVVTNKAETLALPIMQAMAFAPAPVCIVGSDPDTPLKPDPALLLRACEHADLDPAQCIYIGDSARDMQAGIAADMLTIGVGYGYIPANDDIHAWKATRIADTVAELGTAISALQEQIEAGTVADKA